jgi:hypothetical protein
MEAKGGANRGFPKIQERLDLYRQLKERPLHSNWPQSGILALFEVPGELGEDDATVRGDVERRITSAVPAVIPNSPGETSIEDAVWRISRDVPDAHPAPGADVSGNHV